MICPREVAGYLARARRAVQVAEALLGERYAGEATSRAYYAMFYTAQALLKSEDVHVTRHSAVEGFFGQRFAKTGRLDPRFHRMLIRARKARETADYVVDEEVTEATAAATIQDAKEFLAAAEALLGPAEGAGGPNQSGP